MSKKSNSQNKPESQNTSKDSKQSTDDLSDDLDFWDLETEPNEIDTSSDELEEIEKILAKNEENDPLLALADIEIPSEEEIINTPDLKEAIEEIEELPEISTKSANIVLPTASGRTIERTPIKPEKAEAPPEVEAEVEPEGKVEAETPREVVPEEKTPKYSKTPVEKIATLVCYLAILAVFGYLIHYASQQHDFSTAKEHDANTPVKGEHASIDTIETWWEKPVSNNTRIGVILVPSATITLDSDATSGVIRSAFYSSEEGVNGDLRPKGDPFTHEFKDGKFIKSGTNQITIHGTDGFEELAHYLHYKSQIETRWTVQVKEAPPKQTAVSSFEPLAHAPIEPFRK